MIMMKLPKHLCLMFPNCRKGIHSSVAALFVGFGVGFFVCGFLVKQEINYTRKKRAALCDTSKRSLSLFLLRLVAKF